MMPSNSFFAQWQEFVPALRQNKHIDILQNITQLRNAGHTIYPENNNIFSALMYTAPQKISVIILGQDPYHQAGQAHGLAFSVQEHVKPPPSLKNIFKEIQSDVYGNLSSTPFCPNLSRLARQGVLLLNTILTVEESKPLSHAHMGWQEITTSILQALAGNAHPLIALLWGKPAGAYAHYFTLPQHLVLKAPHPSPLSAHRGFLGCKHFSKANAWLKKHNSQPIVW